MKILPHHKAKELIDMFKNVINNDSLNKQEKAEQAALIYSREIKRNVNSKNIAEYVYWLDVIQCIKSYQENEN